VSGPITGQPPDHSDLRRVCAVVQQVPVFANTGVNIDNVATVLSVADGVIVGTHLKVDGNTWNPVDVSRVKRFMDVVNSLR
jgi:predicted TIM-barrel enzyme